MTGSGSGRHVVIGKVYIWRVLFQNRELEAVRISHFKHTYEHNFCNNKMITKIAEQIKKFDAYPKTLEDFRIKTFAGATGLCFII